MVIFAVIVCFQRPQRIASQFHRGWWINDARIFYVLFKVKNYEEIIVILDFDGHCGYAEVPGSAGYEVSGGGP
jgi:hypothetical protein